MFYNHMHVFPIALAVVAGLLGAVLGSAHPIASALVSGIAGSLIAGVTMVVCIATLPHHVFGVSGVQLWLRSIKSNVLCLCSVRPCV